MKIFHQDQMQNLSFVIELAKKFNVKKSNLIEVVKKFKALIINKLFLKKDF